MYSQEKSIYNRETISRQEHRIGEYRIKGVIAWGGRPPEAVGKIQLPRRTRPDPRRSQHGRLE